MDIMTIPCGACRDLLPLYAEGMASEESAALTEAHLNACEHCRVELERIRENPAPAQLPFERSMRRAKRKLNRKKTVIAIFASLLATVIAVIGVIFALTYVNFPIGLKPEDVEATVQHYSEYSKSAEGLAPEIHREQYLDIYTKRWFARDYQQQAVRENEDGSLTMTFFITAYDPLLDHFSLSKRDGRSINLYVYEPKALDDEHEWVMRPEPPVVHWRVYFINYRDWEPFCASIGQLWAEAKAQYGYNEEDMYVPELCPEYIDGTDQIRPELLAYAVLLAEGTAE